MSASMSDSSGSTTADSSNAGSPLEASFMGVVLFVMFGCLFTGWKTPETVVFLCLVLVWNVGLVGTTEALSGFSNAGMLAVGALFVVIKGVEKSQIADKAARQVFGLRTSLSAGLARLMSLCFVLSAFLNNTPVVALLIPITRDWARARGFSPSTFLIPLSYSCIMGGLLTVIGTSTNLVVQGLVLVEAKTDPTIERIGFFEPGYVGVPLGVLGMAYLVVFAPRVLPSCGGLFRYVRDRAKELLTEVQVMDEFPYIGEPAGLVLVRLGLPQDTLIKIRRRIPSGILRQMSVSLEGNASLLLPPGAPPTEGGGGGGGIGVDANTLMEANQKTLRAEGMYSYRLRAECLWGTTGDVDAAAEEKSLTPAPRGPRRSGSFIRRKRWASDADASDLATAKNKGRAATPSNAAIAPEHCSTTGNATANGGSVNATASANGAGGDKGSGTGDGAANAASVEGSDGETYTDIFPVSPAEPVQAGDVLFLSCAQATMIDFQSVTVSQGLKGLKFLDVNALDLPGHGTEFFEIVLSDHNHFVGRSADRDNSEFAAYYGCSVVAVRRRGRSEAVAPSAASMPATVSRGCAGAASTTGGGDGGGGGGGGDGGGWTPSAAPFKDSSMVTDAAEVCLEEGLPAEPAFDPSSGPPTPASLSSGKASTKLAAAAAMAGRSEVRSPPRGTRSAVRAVRSPLRSLRKEADAQEGDDVTGLSFKAGDVVLVLAKEEFMEKYAPSKDFFLLTKVGSVPKPVRYYDYLPLLAFLGMLCWVLFDSNTDMVQAAFAAGAVLILGGWVDAKKIVGYIDWSLLLLIGSALGLSKGIVNSGLAGYVGRAIRDSGISPDASLFVLYAFTMTCTELITNNAAAALATPIAFNISRELNVSYKPFILTVMLAASSSFITPIGYQTNTLVWGPGGYRFTDFIKIGTPLSMIYLVIGCLLVPRFFPF